MGAKMQAPKKTGFEHTVETRLLMGTTVTIRVVSEAGHSKTSGSRRGQTADMHSAMGRAFAAMRFVEATCSRFSEDSALRELCRHPGETMRVPAALFETIRLAVEMSALTDGVFDPTVGGVLESHGFNRHYLTGEAADSDIMSAEPVSYRDITLDEKEGTVLLHKPMLLDLGAVAKGLAIDLAARELADWDGFAIDAGGDLYVHGMDFTGEPWTVGVQHPLSKDAVICWLQTTDVAICTSGSYERRSPLANEIHHLINPLTGESVHGLLSCTVVAPLAMLADAVSTAAFVLGAKRALDFVSGLDLQGLCIDETLDMTMTDSMERYLK